MNTDKVNATLLRAISLFKEDENRMLRSSKGDVQLSGLEEALAKVAKDLSEQTGKPFLAVLDACIDALSEEAARHFAGASEADLTEAKLADWLNAGGANDVAEKIVEQLS